MLWSVRDVCLIFGVWCVHCCCLVCLILRARLDYIDRVYTLWFG